LSTAIEVEDWTGENVRLADVESALTRLRAASAKAGAPPNLRTSVMTHLAWVPEEWLDAARGTLGGMAELHPSRTILLVPFPDSGKNQIDAVVSLECYPVPGVDRNVCSDVVELHLHGPRAKAPASIVEPLLITDLPVFLRWRGQPPWRSQELEQLVDVTDRHIAWARIHRWRELLASLWPGIANVNTIRVHGTPAQAWLLLGWLRSRLERDDITLEIDERERLVGIDLDGQPAPFPPGDPPSPSDVLSEELDRFGRDRVYEDAVRAAAMAA
jgi:hypothetical protein